MAKAYNPETAQAMAETLRLKLDYEQLTNCMRCGFCLPACPTFGETGIEAESPRGRIALMKAVADGVMQPDPAFEEQMNHCLGCRACEPACPAGVKYGQLIEQARDAVEAHTTSHRWWVRIVRKAAFRYMFPKQSRMRRIGALLRFYQKSGLQRLVRGLGLMKLFPESLQQMERILPEASGRGVAEQIGTIHPAQGEEIAKVGLFRGCIMDVLFADTNLRTVELLTSAGFTVVIPPEQNCCGALHAHNGESETAKLLARSNIRAFKQAEVDYIVSNAGGCGALLAEYNQLLQDDPGMKTDADWFSSRVIDVSTLLDAQGRLPEFAEEEVNITYQDSCHLRNAMRGGDAPRRLIRRVPGVTFTELKEADRCCGSAGIYNVTQPEMADRLLERKMAHVKETGARLLLTSNPGCLLQMKLGIAQHGLADRMQAVHIVDFLHERMKRNA